MSLKTVALLGAGGKMGCRITDHLKDNPAYELRYVENGERGLAHLAARGVRPLPLKQAVADAEVVILALPDKLLGKVARDVTPLLRSGTMVVTLDPAAAHSGDLTTRPDLTYFVTHPCHPSVFDMEEDPEARADFFGGVKARMPIVCALMQGPEAEYSGGGEVGSGVLCARKPRAPDYGRTDGHTGACDGRNRRDHGGDGAARSPGRSG